MFRGVFVLYLFWARFLCKNSHGPRLACGFPLVHHNIYQLSRICHVQPVIRMLKLQWRRRRAVNSNSADPRTMWHCRSVSYQNRSGGSLYPYIQLTFQQQQSYGPLVIFQASLYHQAKDLHVGSIRRLRITLPSWYNKITSYQTLKYSIFDIRHEVTAVSSPAYWIVDGLARVIYCWWISKWSTFVEVGEILCKGRFDNCCPNTCAIGIGLEDLKPARSYVATFRGDQTWRARRLSRSCSKNT